MTRTIIALCIVLAGALAIGILSGRRAAQARPAEPATAAHAADAGPSAGDRMEESDRSRLQVAGLEHEAAHLRVQVLREQLARLQEADKAAEAKLDAAWAQVREHYRLGDRDTVNLATGAINRAAQVSQ